MASFAAPSAAGIRRPVGLAALGRARVAVSDYDGKAVSIFDLNSAKAQYMGKIGVGRLLGERKRYQTVVGVLS